MIQKGVVRQHERSSRKDRSSASMSRSRHLVVAVLIFAKNDEVYVGLSMFGLDLDCMPV